jgi:N-acetylneuraminic acid mutarotase
LPYATKFDNLCVIDGKVYISEHTSPVILEYNPNTDTWMTLLTPTKGHGMASLNGKLTLVGGLTKESTPYNLIVTSNIRVWDSDSKQWTELPYPPMSIKRIEMECASYSHYLIIAGGRICGEVEMAASIDILDTKSGEWFKAPPLPQYGWFHSQTMMITIGESLCISFIRQTLIKHYKYLWRVSLPTLISHTLQGEHHDTSIWEEIPAVPHNLATIFSIGNMLLTGGGDFGGYFTYKPSADIHLFNPHINEWLKIGELPEPRFLCACTLLPSGKLLVAGGKVDGNCLLPTVYTATITGPCFEPIHF